MSLIDPLKLNTQTGSIDSQNGGVPLASGDVDNYFVQNQDTTSDSYDISLEELQESLDGIDSPEEETRPLIQLGEEYSFDEVYSMIQIMSGYSAEMDKIVQKYYPNQNIETLSDDDIKKALLCESMAKNMGAAQSAVEKYFNTEGCIDNIYNFLKEATNLGISDVDIQRFQENEALKNSILVSALANGGIEFSDNEENLSPEELLALGQVSKDTVASLIQEKIAHCDNIEDIFSYCMNNLSMSENDVILLMTNYVKQNEIDYYDSLGVDTQQAGIEVKIEKDNDGKYNISFSGDISVYYFDNSIELNEYFNKNGMVSRGNTSVEGNFSDFSKYLADNFELEDEYSFEQMYSFFTGVEYDQQKIDEISRLTPAYTQATTNYLSAQNLEKTFESFSSPTQAVDYFQNTLDCSREEAIQCFNEYYKNNIAKLIDSGYEGPYGKCLSFELSPDGKNLKEQYFMDEEIYSALYLGGSLPLGGKYDKNTGIFTIETDIEMLDYSKENNFEYTNYCNFSNINREINEGNLISAEAIKAYNESDYAKEYGNFDEILEKYSRLSEQAYGKNILSEEFALYQNDMDTYSSKIASAMTTIGLAGSFVAGGPFGLLALAGTFTDNAIDLGNLATNKVDGEFAPWALQTMQEAGAVAIGFGLGAAANKIGDAVCANLIKGGSTFGFGRAMGTSVEALVDFGMSYPADVLYEAMFTGQFNWEGNLFGNILGSAMDIKGGIGAYRAFKGADSGFDYVFKDGTQMHLDSTGKGYIVQGAKTIVIDETNARVVLEGFERTQSEAPRASFNPETGELEVPRTRGDDTDIQLDHPTRGDSVSDMIKNKTLSADELIRLWQKNGDLDFSSVDYKNLTAEQRAQIETCAIGLSTKYATEIQGIKEMYSEIFGAPFDTSVRGKSPKSTLEKLIAKQADGKLTEVTVQEAAKLIGDGYGIRVQMPSLTSEQADSIIREALAGTGKTQAQFQKMIDEGDFDALLADSDFKAAFEKLKEARSKDTVDILVREIEAKHITPANGKNEYFNNYGSEITSYFTNGQLLLIDKAYFDTYQRHLTFVNKTPVEIPNDEMDMSPEAKKTIDLASGEKAEKASGYTDAQFNILTSYTDKNNPLGDMELQIRGVEVHKIAEVEHIPYDIRQGKITATDPKYSQYYSFLKGMSPESYKQYNEYLKASYTWATLKELNLATDKQKPQLTAKLSFGDAKYLQEAGVDISFANKTLTGEEIEKITLEGLAIYKGK